jgi:hypothetical protein
MEMTDDEHKQLASEFYMGKVLIGLDRSIARKFYTDVPFSHIIEETGEAPYFEKTVVFGAFVGGPLALFVSFILAVLAFHWWAALVIPASIVLYVVFSGASSMPKQGMASVSVLLGLTLLGLYLDWFPSKYVGWYAAVIIFALWNARLVYAAATYFIRAFVVRNRRAYEFLSPHIQIREARS